MGAGTGTGAGTGGGTASGSLQTSCGGEGARRGTAGAAAVGAGGVCPRSPPVAAAAAAVPPSCFWQAASCARRSAMVVSTAPPAGVVVVKDGSIMNTTTMVRRPHKASAALPFAVNRNGFRRRVYLEPIVGASTHTHTPRTPRTPRTPHAHTPPHGVCACTTKQGRAAMCYYFYFCSLLCVAQMCGWCHWIHREVALCQSPQRWALHPSAATTVSTQHTTRAMEKHWERRSQERSEHTEAHTRRATHPINQHPMFVALEKKCVCCAVTHRHCETRQTSTHR